MIRMKKKKVENEVVVWLSSAGRMGYLSVVTGALAGSVVVQSVISHVQITPPQPKPLEALPM